MKLLDPKKIKQYPKTIWPVGRGYDLRPNGVNPVSLLIHSTNGNEDSSFEDECLYLRDSRSVSAHYVVGKEGQIGVILPPVYRAWHAGSTIAPFQNSLSIGIECHHAVGDSWPNAQIESLTALCDHLIWQHQIQRVNIDTHRKVALPAGRKPDPSDWNDEDFYAWRDALFAPAPLVDRRVIGVTPMITQAQFSSSLARHKVDVSFVESGRIYNLLHDLNIEPSFFIALWHAEDVTFGRGLLQRQSRMPLNIKAAAGEWRPTVAYDGEKWLAAESLHLGCIYSAWHLKNVHGWAGRHTVRQIVESHAPASDGNDPAQIVKNILEDMAYIAAH